MLYKQVHPSQDLATYCTRVVETLFRNLAFSVRKTVDRPDEENIHDLRVLCLRLRHALRLFGKLYPRKPARKINRRLRDLQELLAAVRTCDIAASTLQSVSSAVPAANLKKITSDLGAERRQALRPLRAQLRKMHQADTLHRWRARLLSSS